MSGASASTPPGGWFPLLILAVLYLVLVFAYALASLILLGLPSQADAQAMYGVDVGRSVLNAFRALSFYTLAAFPLWLGGMSLAIACHFLITNSTIAAFSYLGILMVLPMALDNLGKYVNPMFTSLYHLTLTYHMDQLLVGGPALVQDRPVLAHRPGLDRSVHRPWGGPVRPERDQVRQKAFPSSA